MVGSPREPVSGMGSPGFFLELRSPCRGLGCTRPPEAMSALGSEHQLALVSDEELRQKLDQLEVLVARLKAAHAVVAPPKELYSPVPSPGASPVASATPTPAPTIPSSGPRTEGGRLCRRRAGKEDVLSGSEGGRHLDGTPRLAPGAHCTPVP